MDTDLGSTKLYIADDTPVVVELKPKGLNNNEAVCLSGPLPSLRLGSRCLASGSFSTSRPGLTRLTRMLD